MSSELRQRHVEGCTGILFSEDGGQYDDKLVSAVSPCGGISMGAKLIEASLSNLSDFKIIADLQTPHFCYHHMLVANQDLVFVPCGSLLPYQSNVEMIWDRSKQRLYTSPPNDGAVIHILRAKFRSNVFHSWHARLIDFDFRELQKLDGLLPHYHLEHCAYDLDKSETNCTLLNTDSWLNLLPIGKSYVGVSGDGGKEWFHKVCKIQFIDDTNMIIQAEREFEHVLFIEVMNNNKTVFVLHKESITMRVQMCHLDATTLEDRWCVDIPIPLNKVAHTMKCDSDRQCRSSTDIRIEN